MERLVCSICHEPEPEFFIDLSIGFRLNLIAMHLVTVHEYPDEFDLLHDGKHSWSVNGKVVVQLKEQT